MADALQEIMWHLKIEYCTLAVHHLGAGKQIGFMK